MGDIIDMFMWTIITMWAITMLSTLFMAGIQLMEEDIDQPIEEE